MTTRRTVSICPTVVYHSRRVVPAEEAEYSALGKTLHMSLETLAAIGGVAAPTGMPPIRLSDSFDTAAGKILDWFPGIVAATELPDPHGPRLMRNCYAIDVRIIT